MSSKAVQVLRSTRVMVWVLVLTLACYIASRVLLTYVEPGSLGAALSALLPLPGMLYVYSAWAVEAAHSDELERRIALEGVAVGLGLSFAVVLLLGQLELGGIVESGAVPIRSLGHMMVATTLLGIMRARLRYA